MMNCARTILSLFLLVVGAYLPSLETAYTVGHVVVSEVLTHWPQYSQAVAGADKTAASKP